ncbi:cytochrome P450 [Aspergillus alliaceus]|uniref:Cytochrome P450 n=1 Tax=Petromyces alliaceus TaxID=209559 RepID=A0A5N6FCM5_PETAA|nr:cytochrome P450 [Aspergillus alliaceus]KAB8227686.1 cytochrome P450 [Aspergillus alliaceus]KAE8388151.1 cytochrome P450 [Aspergillus alliaceus]
MISFLEFWLCTLTLASGGIVHQALTCGEHIALLFQVLGAHVVAFVAFAVYWMILYPRYFTPLGNIPTPSRRRILTGNYPVLFPDNAWVPLRELAETTPNDGLLRIYSTLSGEALLVTSPPAIRDMLTVNAFDFAHQDLVKIAIKRFTGSNLGFLSNDEFKLHRKNMMPAFTVPHVRKLTSIFWAKAQEMVHCMSNELRADPFARINFREYVSRATLDNIGLAGMGHDFQTLKQPDNDLRSHYRKLILDPTRVFSWVGLLSRYFDMRLLMRVPLKKLIEISQSANYLRAVTTAVIQDRSEKLVEAEDNRAKDIITVALASGVFDERHLVDHVMTFLTAGHESTATAFEWTMYELGRRPEMQSRLRDELREAIGTDLAAVDFGLRVQNLPYLNAFCSEVLRCYPFSPIIVKVAQQETTLMGQRIPKGTVVLYSAEVSNHDKTLWGPDADKFDPERWIGEGKAKSGGASSNYAMLTFGAGPRNCIGANFARATLECLVAAVLSTFEIELVNPDTAGRLKFGQTKKSAEGVYGRLKFVRPVEV